MCLRWCEKATTFRRRNPHRDENCSLRIDMDSRDWFGAIYTDLTIVATFTAKRPE